MGKAIVHQEFAPDRGVLSFYTYDVLTKLLHDLVEAYPDLASIESIGKSLEGRDLWLVTVTNKQTGLALEKPAYWIDGNTHAGEVTGSTVVLYTLWSYLTNYSRDATLTRLLDRSAIYCLPRISVDGAERYLTLTDSNAPLGGYDSRAFAGLPEEIRLRLLKRAIDRCGHEGPAELGKVETLLATIDRTIAGRQPRLKQTLAGAAISLSKGRIRVLPAPPRRRRPA